MTRSYLSFLLIFFVACGSGVTPGSDGGDGGDLSSDVIGGDSVAVDTGDARDVSDDLGEAFDDVTDVASADVFDASVTETVEDTHTDTADDAADTVSPDSNTDSVMFDVVDVVDVPDSGFVDVSEDVPDDAGGDAPDVTETPDVVEDTGTAAPLAVRIVASNLSSGNYQSYDPGHGIRILDALNPDIVLVQEFNYGDNNSSDYSSFVQKVIGSGYWAVDDADFQIPNGVVSRWPITGSGYWDDPNLSNRELMWATIDIPGPVDLMAVSVHLHTSPAADQVEAAGVIVTKVKSHRAANPGRYMYVVGGDFNGTSSVSSSGFGKDDTFYVDPPDPVDDEDNPNTNANRNSQYDFVLGDPALHAFQVPVVFPSTSDASGMTYPDGLVFDTRTFEQAQLNEYFPPALTGDSAASNMQHMGVVKDFLIQ